MRVKTQQELDAMREGGRMLATVLDVVKKQMKDGISTKDLDDIALAEVKKLGGRPAFLNHDNFPASLCTSINQDIVHGLPNPKTILKKGDVIGLDFGVLYKGLNTDSAITAVVGGGYPSKDIERLLKGTEESLMVGLDAIKGEGTRVGDVSAAVQAVLDKHKLGIIRDLVGHAVGDEIHEEPNIPNYGVKGTGPVLQVGATYAVEPMASLGDWHIKTSKDGWSIEMSDGSIGAHFEHTIVITETGCEILTTL